MNYPVKALNISVHAFKAEATSVLMPLILCVSHDTVPTRNTLQAVLYIQGLCSYSTISKNTV